MQGDYNELLSFSCHFWCSEDIIAHGTHIHSFPMARRLKLIHHSPFGFVFRVVGALQVVIMMLCISYELILNATANSQLLQEE